jgi:hypothetical protein
MTTQHRVVRASTTDQRPSTDYATDVARIVCLSKGSPSEALQLCKQFRVSDRVTDYFERAAVNPGVISDPGFAGDLVDPMPFAFLQSLQHKSVFDRVSQHSVQCPLNRHVAATTLVATGADAIEGEYKKISELEITGGKVPITKAACILVWDNALLKLGSPDALALIRRELTSGTSRATDETYLQLVTAGASSMAAGGNDLDSIRDGLRWMLQSVNTGAESKLFYVTSSPIAKALSIMGGDTGFAFPAMTPSGGFVGGVEVLVSDVVADDEVILISAD